MHWLFLTIAAVVLLLSFLMRSEGEQSVFLPGLQSAMPEMCGAKVLLGISCPGCGLTRSFIAISSGQLRHAWNLNPASFLLYLFVAVQIPWQIFQLSRVHANRPIIDTMWVFAPLVICSTGLTIQWLVKLCMGIMVT